MGRAEVGTPKYLANKMKAKGLQKLRWYCQMCEKQCRDENGFKCHTMSEAHQRQLLLFADSPGKFIYSFSKDFSDGYMELVRRRFGTKRVNANRVYQEYISCKDHIHMNSTRWLTLSDYVKWLGRTGQVVADETEKGWYITYIDRSPEAMERQAKAEKKERMEKDDEERMREFIEKQIERDVSRKRPDEAATEEHGEAAEKEPDTKELQREDDKPLCLNMRLERKHKPESSSSISRSVFEPIVKRAKRVETGEVSSSNSVVASDEAVFKVPRSVSSTKSELPTTSRNGILMEIVEEEERRKELNNRRDYWLHPGIIVKFVSKSLGTKYYKKKAVVLELVTKYSAKIKFLESGEKLKVDQGHLETIIPNLNHSVLVVNGAYRGQEGVLLKVDEEKGTASVELLRGIYKGRIVKAISFDDICKLK